MELYAFPLACDELIEEDIPAGDELAEEELDEGKLWCDGDDISLPPFSVELLDLFSL